MRPGRARRLAAVAALAALFATRAAVAGDDDLLDDEPKAADPKHGSSGDESGDKKDGGFGTYTPPVATIKGHAYSLEECLALADRNAPVLWAARARVAATHAQLEEATWAPFSQWSVSSNAFLIGPLPGSPVYTTASQASRNLSWTSNVGPFVTVDFSGVIPLYTFGKITSIRDAASANIRVSEWDMEKQRAQVRADVRRAFFGAMLARDARYVLSEVLERLDHGIDGVKKKIAKNDPSVEEVDRIRLEVQKDTILARSGEPEKGERYAMAALRFLTGVQTSFDIPDEPLKKPDVVIAPLVRYLAAARIFRPDINMARAGIVARKAQVEFAKAQLFPDFGIGLGASYAVSEMATPQYGNIWANDPFNHFYTGGGIGLRWGLDLLPKVARIHQAESQLEETRALERLALGGVAVEVENAYGTVVEAKMREQSWDDAEHRTKRWIVTVSDAIDLGTRDERQLIEPLRAYLDAKVNHEYALMDLNLALSELARVSGWDSAAPTGK